MGHQVVLLCQEGRPDRFGFVDAWGTVGPEGPSDLTPTGAAPAPGRVVLLRPRIGPVLPVFVLDRYPGFRARRFVDLSPGELEAYLEANVRAVAAAARWHRPEGAMVGHAVPGPAIARRSLGPGRYVAKVHGSDLEYAVRVQRRYRELAQEGLAGARAVVGPTREVIARLVALVPGVAGKAHAVPPGVDPRFRPIPRPQALSRLADLLAADPETARGRPGSLDAEVAGALDRRDGRALSLLAGRYDQDVPDPEAAGRVRALARAAGPLVGYLGKLIPEKGVDLLLQALPGVEAHALVVGFGLHREWLAALVMALDRADREALAWLGRSGVPVDLPEGVPDRVGALASRVAFTGRLDHRYAPLALASLDVQVVPSVLSEAFGMVAAEGAAAGALPLVARHSGLAEVADTLEGVVGRPGALSFEPGPGAPGRIRDGLRRLLGLPAGDRATMRQALAAFVAREWTWERTARRLLELAS
jgi:glycosyltransferase involved in cell wall biosynthesis